MRKYLLTVLAAAFVIASCSPSQKLEPEIPGGSSQDTTPTGTVTPPSVTTGDAEDIGNHDALIVNKFDDAPIRGASNRGVRYGLSADDLNRETTLGKTTSRKSSFNIRLTGLERATTYYYQAFITVWDANAQQDVDILGAVKQFTTTDTDEPDPQPDDPDPDDPDPDDPDPDDPDPDDPVPGLQYLGGYEIPAISLQNKNACSGSGADSDGPWFNYNTTDSNQKIVTHAYTYSGKQYRNWTALVDKTKKAALWNAFVMHDDAYPDNDAGRNDSWRNDPAIPSDWQQGGISGYSRGHMVASNYRQTCKTANRQTFYHTNQAPQFQTQFNDGVWNNLEQAVKSHAPSGRDTLYVVVGVLYENNKTVSGVPVPSHFYKLLMKCSFNTSGTMTAAKGCAYIFTNEAHPGMNYSQGITSIDAIEQRSGFDFFHNIPQSLQDAAEKTSSGLW